LASDYPKRGIHLSVDALIRKSAKPPLRNDLASTNG
jgi:hypothetical protein